MVRRIERTALFRTGDARPRAILAARAVLWPLACTQLGLPAAAVARALGVARSAVLQAIPRGQTLVAPQPVAFARILRAINPAGA